MDDKKAPIVFPDDGPIKLKIPPKSCELCGKPFIPTGGNAKYCPRCRDMSKDKRDRSLFSKHATMVFGHGPWSKEYDEAKGEDSKADLIPMVAQIARLYKQIKYDNGLGMCHIDTVYDSGKIVPHALLLAKDFFEVFGDKDFEYIHTPRLMTVRRWEHGVLFEAVIS